MKFSSAAAQREFAQMVVVAWPPICEEFWRIEGEPKTGGENRSFQSLGKDFLGGPVVKTRCSHCRGLRFDPWLGN